MRYEVRTSNDVVVVHDPQLAHQVLAGTNNAYLHDTSDEAGKRAQERMAANVGQEMSARRGVFHAFADHLTRVHHERFVGSLEPELAERPALPLDVVATLRRISGRALVDFCFGGGRTTPDQLAAITDATSAMADDLVAAMNKREARVRWLPKPAAAAWLLVRLAEHRDVAERIAAEAATTELASAHEAGTFPFARAVVKETLRLHPPQWLLIRTARHANKLGEYDIGAARVCW